MGLLVDGRWHTEAQYAEARTGEFVRQASRFRSHITTDGSSGFKAEAGRYHLYVARACPWCHRTMIFRVLTQLQNVISMSMVEPSMLEEGWSFAEPDPLTGARHVYEIYQRADPKYSGRATVPIIW